jgi:hypothetical protein
MKNIYLSLILSGVATYPSMPENGFIYGNKIEAFSAEAEL